MSHLTRVAVPHKRHGAVAVAEVAMLTAARTEGAVPGDAAMSDLPLVCNKRGVERSGIVRAARSTDCECLKHDRGDVHEDRRWGNREARR